MQNTTISKKNMLMRLTVVLLCLVLLSLGLFVGLFARYSSAGSGTDRARTAGFSPAASLNLQSRNFVYDPTKKTYSGSYEVMLTNASEVAVKYDVVISFQDTALSGAEFTFNQEKKVVDENASDITFSDVGVLEANDTTGIKKIMTVTVNSDFYNALMRAQDGENLDLTAYFDTAVVFTQVD
jgi:hypothetical protein